MLKLLNKFEKVLPTLIKIHHVIDRLKKTLIINILILIVISVINIIFYYI